MIDQSGNQLNGGQNPGEPGCCNPDHVAVVYPVAAEGLLFTADGKYSYVTLFADSISSGSITWQQLVADSQSESTTAGWGLISYADGVLLYATYGSTNLQAFLGGGSSLWSVTTAGNIATIPTVGDDLIVIGFTDLTQLGAYSMASGGKLWSFPMDGYSVGTPSYSGGTFYAGTTNGTVYAVSEAGTQSWKAHVGSAILSTPAIAYGRVFVTTTGGNLVILNSTDGTLLASYSASSSITSSPIISSNGVVYFGDTLGDVFAVDATTGSLDWTTNAGSPIVSSPLLLDGELFVFDQGGTLHVFGSPPAVTTSSTTTQTLTTTMVSTASVTYTTFASTTTIPTTIIATNTVGTTKTATLTTTSTSTSISTIIDVTSLTTVSTTVSTTATSSAPFPGLGSMGGAVQLSVLGVFAIGFVGLASYWRRKP